MKNGIFSYSIYESVRFMISFTPHSTGLYLAMTLDTIWGSLMMLSLPHPLKLYVTKHLFKDLCFLEQFNASKHLSPTPSLELGTRMHPKKNINNPWLKKHITKY